MLGFCEHSNEHMDSVKCREFLAKLRNQACIGLFTYTYLGTVWYD